jgi:polysaccharide biosynthesis/export protein
MLGFRSIRLAKFAILFVAVSSGLLAGCKGSAVPGLTTPDFALSTPAPLPGPGEAFPAGAGSSPPGVPVVPNETYTLDSGDHVRVIVFGQDNLSNVYGVDGSGAVAMPLIGPVRARGLTTFELANEIAGKLSRKYVKDPKVTVEVATYRPFFILGEVNRPGQYPYVNAMTVEAAVAISEGYTERAKKRFVRLTRRFGGVMSTVMVPTDYPVQPGDTIYVLERFF